MTDPAWPLSPQIVTVFGGSGFLGRAVVAVLARQELSASASRCAGRTLPAMSSPSAIVGQIHAGPGEPALPGFGRATRCAAHRW